jgi:hypothetical protein
VPLCTAGNALQAMHKGIALHPDKFLQGETEKAEIHGEYFYLKGITIIKPLRGYKTKF